MISRRWASLHLRLQNLLPHQRCVTMPEWPTAAIAALASRPRSWSRLIRDLDDRYEALARRLGAEAAG